MTIILVFCATVWVLAQATSDKKIVCYWRSWSVYREGDGNFDLSNFDSKLCTHLLYSFVGLSNKSGEVISLDDNLAFRNSSHKNTMDLFNNYRKRNPQLKTLLAIGGWGQGSAIFSRAVADPIRRRKFADSSVAFIKKYGFDGFDIDWEFPAHREGSSPADKQNFVLLLKELRSRFDREGLILCAAVAAVESSVNKSYIIPEVSKYLHFINIMAYNLHGTWDKKTGMHAALFPAKSESGDAAKLNIDYVVKLWLAQGAPAEKLVLGISFYARTFALVDPKSNGVGAPASAGDGIYAVDDGILGYDEICDKIKREHWNVTFDTERRVPYAINGKIWASYDNQQSIKEKADLIIKYNLGGAMIWSIDTDDFRGKCGEKFPLLKTLQRTLGKSTSANQRYSTPK